MDIAAVPIELYRNSGFKETFQFLTDVAAKTPLPLTGYEFQCQIKDADGNAILDINGDAIADITVTIDDSDNGIISLSMLSDDVKLLPLGTYLYDLLWQAPGEDHFITATGDATIMIGATQWQI